MSSPLVRKKNSDEDAKSPQIRVARSAYTRVVVKKLLSFITVSLVALLLLYVCIAATIVRIVPTTNGMGLVPVKNITYSGYIIPKDAEIIVDTDHNQENNVFGRLKQAFIPSDSTAKIKVVAGPYGKIDWTGPDILSVDGQPLNVHMKSVDGKSPLGDLQYLDEQYVGICLDGNCVKGEAVIIGKKNIVGSPLSSKNE